MPTDFDNSKMSLAEMIEKLEQLSQKLSGFRCTYCQFVDQTIQSNQEKLDTTKACPLLT